VRNVRRAVLTFLVGVAAVLNAFGTLWASTPPPSLRLTGAAWLAYSWQSYDYDGGRGDGQNVFYPATRTAAGLAVDDRGWRIDTPESPDSVLAMLTYTTWEGGYTDDTSSRPQDLRGRTVSFLVRGHALDLKGGRATFWVESDWTYARFHHVDHFDVTEDWQAVSFAIADTPRLEEWHRSWNPDGAADLTTHMTFATSVGVGFVGFGAEPTGTLEVANLTIA
jgi:hypothetical protein